LFLSFRGIEYRIEAKFAYTDCEASVHGIHKRVDKTLAWATSDARQVKVDGSRRLGVAFIAPFMREQDPESMVAGISRWKEAVGKTRCGAYAWVLPREGWNMKWKGFVHPGAAMLVRAVRG
jgi:hypothetical protein